LPWSSISCFRDKGLLTPLTGLYQQLSCRKSADIGNANRLQLRLSKASLKAAPAWRCVSDSAKRLAKIYAAVPAS